MKRDEQNRAARQSVGAVSSNHFRRRLLPALVASCFACGPVFANPTGAQVVNGQVNISSNGNVLTVTNSPGSIINWLNFSIGAGQITQFLQQNSSSAVLNRIIGQNPSQIFGTLESNGKVFLVNPNGILFAPGSQTNVGGLVASSLDISNTDFISGKLNFAASTASPGSVVNQGSITAPSGGNIYLIAPQVQNSGVITSPQGEVLLAAGHSVQLIDGADPNIQVVISSADDQVTNLGQVIAQGGKIGIYGALVNQNGTASADSAVIGQNGAVVFKSSQSTILGANSVSSAQGAGQGGSVEVLGPNVELIDNALVNASGQTGGGKVMIGGDFHGANAAIPDSTTVFVGADSVIKADAIQSGNGGKVAVWADNSTLYFGSISAQGGAAGGNGGYVETSGKYNLNFDGTVNTLAPQGQKGTLLLDPYAITITSDATQTPEIVPTAGTPTIYISPVTSFVLTTGGTGLDAQLGLANVLIETGAAAGTITVASPVTWSTENTLSLVASSNININAAITATSGTLALNSSGGNITQTAPIAVAALSAVANSNAAGYGNVQLNNAGNSVGTIAGSAAGSGGFVFFNSAATAIGSVAGYTNGVAGTISGISASAGNVQIQSGGALSITQPINAAGTAYLTATTGNITQTAPGIITAANLSVYAPAGSVTLNGTVPFGPYNSVTGTVAGSSSGAFSFMNSPGFSIGGTLGNLSGITSSTSVSVASTAGSILSSGSGAITAPTVAINALDGIGVQGAPLLTAASILSIVNGCNDGCPSGFGGGGDVVVSNTGALTVSGITQLNNSGSEPTSNIILSNNSTINVTGTIGTPLGSIGISTSSGAITVNGGISASSGNIGLTASSGMIGIYAPVTASGTVALQASGNIYQALCGTCNITAASLMAVSSSGYVSLTNTANNVGIVAGSASGSTDGGAGFAFTNSSAFSVGSVTAIGSPFSTMGNYSGITSTNGGVVLAAAGNISIGGPINAGTSYVSLAPTAGGGIIQASGGSITTTGTLYLATTGNIGASGAGNSIATNVGTISAAEAGDLYINNSGTGLLNVPRVSASGVVNIATAGAMDMVASDYTFTGSSITLVSAGNMSFANNSYLAGGGYGAITLYAGYNEANGATPVANVTTSTLTQGGSFTGNPINLWANSFADFLNTGGATYSTAANYHPTAAPIDITVTGTTVDGKVYNANTDATLSGGVLQGVPSVDLPYLTLLQSGQFASKNVGTGIAVTATDVLEVPAALAGDFVLVQPTGLTGNITPATLTVTGQTASKTYDGTTNATLSGGTLTGVYSGDTVTLTSAGTGQYASKDVGHNIAVSLTTPDTLGGADVGNYVLVQPTVTGSITPAVLTVTGQTASNKSYDGTTSATLQNGTLTGLVAGDAGTVTLGQAGSFSSIGPGNAIPIIAADTLSGSGASNYVLTQPTYIVASITAPTSAAITNPQVEQATQTYIVSLNTTTTNVLGSTGSGLSTGSESGKFGGGTSINNDLTTGTNKDGSSNKLYCN